MTTTLVEPSVIHAPYDVRKLRRAASLTRMQVAELSSVQFEHVVMFEKGQPVPLDSRRRILRELWAIICRK